MKVECLSCHGVYDTVLPDGLLYFHRCPPLSAAEIQDGLKAGTVQLPPADADRLQAALDADAQAPPKADDIAHADRVLASLVIERPNARDENVIGGTERRGAGNMRAAGAGVRQLP